MNASTSPELFYLVLTAGLTGITWMAYVVNRMLEIGLWPTLSNPKTKTPKNKWAQRMIHAHGNAVENLVVFIALVLAIPLSHTNNEVTAMAATIFFYARLTHMVVYTLGIPVVRTFSFLVGFACQAVLFVQFFA